MKKRIAGVQTNVTFADTLANLATMKRWLSDTRLDGCDLVVFPECMLSGYCYDSLDEAWPHSQTVPGPATDELTEVCKRQNRFVAFGLLEKNEQGELYNSCALVGPNGLVGVYRKVHLPYLGIDRFVTRGAEPYAVHDIGGLRVGMHICYDGSFPESARVMALQGADLLILPTNWPPGAETFAKYLPNARALENNVYYLTVNRVGNERGFRFIGQSRLCDTNGNSMCDGPVEGEAILIGDINVEQARNKRLVRVPGKHVIDRMADRCPEYYSLVAQPHNLVRDVGP
jgi:5-aminopentanamidase